MARLRSRGALSLTRLPPISMSPEVMSSRPTIMRSSVDFPQPDGPDEDHELAVGDVEADVVDGREAVAVLLDDVLERDGGHGISFGGAASALDGAGVRPATIRRWNSSTRIDDRDGHDDGGRRDGAGRLLELRGAGEEGQRRRHRPGSRRSR